MITHLTDEQVTMIMADYISQYFLDYKRRPLNELKEALENDWLLSYYDKSIIDHILRKRGKKHE